MIEFTADNKKEKTLARKVRRRSKRYCIGLIFFVLALIGAACCIFVFPGYLSGVLCVILMLAAVLLLAYAVSGGRDFFMTRKDEYIRIEDGIMRYQYHPFGIRKIKDQAYNELEYVIPMNRIIEYVHDDRAYRSGIRCEYTCVEHAWTSELPDRSTFGTDWIYIGDHFRQQDKLTALLKQAAENNGY